VLSVFCYFLEGGEGMNVRGWAIRDYITFFALMFETYAPDAERMYERGEVIKMPDGNANKYLLTGDGRIQTR
jgi:hypothetical protein